MKTNVSSSLRASVVAVLGTVLVAGCGGGNPLDNPPLVDNPLATGGRKLSFAYFQRCVQPVLLSPLGSAGAAGPATCASSGCHEGSDACLTSAVNTAGRRRSRAAVEKGVTDIGSTHRYSAHAAIARVTGGLRWSPTAHVLIAVQ